ncbi:hypothetical protein H5410_048443 [Solanum commersonii]|uniref:Uncharacterized protein n=1 Tax=Solanum commersonii TaxID=4109 RepID=A0A9J5XI36_SOLCO|nr:hypothetical protein H5410_048443 [Solanum commersonii]
MYPVHNAMYPAMWNVSNLMYPVHNAMYPANIIFKGFLAGPTHILKPYKSTDSFKSAKSPFLKWAPKILVQPYQITGWVRPAQQT